MGETIIVSLFDYPPNAPISSLEIAGLAVALPFPVPITSPAGDVAFAFFVPGVALNSVKLPTGPQPFEVFAGGASQDTTLTIQPANLSVSDATIVANQDLTISGSGFTEGGSVCVLEGDITFNNVPLKLDDPDNCPTFISVTDGILLTSGGTFTLTVRVHSTSGDIPTALLVEGTHELKVIDTNGVVGTINSTIPERQLSANPAAGAEPGDQVTIIGQGFIGSNPDGLSTTIGVEYVCLPNITSATGIPDISGNLQLMIPMEPGGRRACRLTLQIASP